MRVRMFQPRFAESIRSGAKRQTIRPIPKRMPRPGDRESWRQWSGKPYRSHQIELAQVELTSVERFTLEETSHEILAKLPDREFNGGLLPIDEWNAFGVKDGFDSFSDLVFWFEKQHGLPFSGILINAK